MENDPDIIRWSQLKRFARNTLGWMAVYGIFGWLGDVTQYNDHSNLTHFFFVGSSICIYDFSNLERLKWKL